MYIILFFCHIYDATLSSPYHGSNVGLRVLFMFSSLFLSRLSETVFILLTKPYFDLNFFFIFFGRLKLENIKRLKYPFVSYMKTSCSTEMLVKLLKE